MRGREREIHVDKGFVVTRKVGLNLKKYLNLKRYIRSSPVDRSRRTTCSLCVMFLNILVLSLTFSRLRDICLKRSSVCLAVVLFE